MTQQMWFSSGGERVRETVEAALAWCESCSLVSDAPTAAERGDAVWKQVGQAAEKVRAAILSNLDAADAEVLAPLYGAARVRRFEDGSLRSGHFISFERGDDMRFLLAPEALRAGTVTGPGLWLYWEGPRAGLPEGLQAIFDQCWASSVAASPADAPPPSVAVPVATYSRPIPSVREVLSIRSSRDYFELDVEDQELALWSALIGEGAIDLEQAIRLGAERLRAQGFLDYQRLHTDGRVYSAIQERLLAGRRRTDLFDRPRNGFVRAIQADLDQLTAEQWRDGLMGALEPGQRVDRDEAVRFGFVNAQTTYGVDAQRLRVGGRADQALRSAVNSAIRQGYLARDGAAYLVRVSPLAAPTLRGVVAVPAAGGTSPESVRAEPSSLVASAGVASAAQAPVVEQPAAISDAAAAPPSAGHIDGESPGAAKTISEAISPLDRPLQSLNLPTRTLNWAARIEIDTVRQLVAWEPEAFAQERNVGRGTVQETREVVEGLLGCTWEQAYVAAHGGAAVPRPSTAPATELDDDSATEALIAGGASGWAQVAASLTAEQRDIALLDVALPTRMRNFVRSEGLQKLGELFQLRHASLAAAANLGRKTLNDTVDAVRTFLAELTSPPTYGTFLQAWQAQLGALEPIPRMIVTRRAGMHGTRETLEELGAMLGVTRERVRQIEARVVERLAERSTWRRLVDTHLTTAFASGRALPLDLLAQDPWWSGIDQQEQLLDYVLRHIFEDQLFLLEAPSGRRYLTKFGPSEFFTHLENAKSRVAKLEYPVEASVVDGILRSETEQLDLILFAELEQVVGESLHRDPEGGELVLGYGRYRADELVAFLNGQPAPVSVAVAEEHCGRGPMPEEVLYFKRGLVGLKRHFPDFEGWMARLVPAALEVMLERPAGRQWLVPELHDILREKALVPEWLGHWHLASLLRLSGRVDYLGRLRVATKDAGQERLQYEALLHGVLEAAGAPLPLTELTSRARLQTDVLDAAASSTTLTAPFIRLDESRVGLLERDVPGGPPAVAAAIEAILERLATTQVGLTSHQATLLVNGVSEAHARWTTSLVLSLLRNEPTLRLDRSKNIGLDEWDDVRCPTRPEFLRRAVQQAGGTLPLPALYARMEELYGRAPDRGSLGVMAQQVGLVIVGESISRPASMPASIPPSAPVERVGINLSGIPSELREVFEEMVGEALSDPSSLRLEVKQHVDVMAEAYQVNEFVDLPGANALARQCNQLLDSWDGLLTPDRHLASAAVRYFTRWDDLENDLDIGGLDDDKQIVNAVLTYLGMEEVVHVAPAS